MVMVSKTKEVEKFFIIFLNILYLLTTLKDNCVCNFVLL